MTPKSRFFGQFLAGTLLALLPPDDARQTRPRHKSQVRASSGGTEPKMLDATCPGARTRGNLLAGHW